ncbi:TetR/AcrR family transcriptional regulator [Mycolicibacterium sp.]|uniref:TetR/AcrR family transcriptional regulator n=1 Tax=Mycolicibacterium sp. TaxID=2320850 RepID=UPI003D0BFCE2
MSTAPSRRVRRDGASAGGGSPQRNPATRDSILDVAIELFAQFGFQGTSMSAVARDAGVAQPLMHYYFSSKDELWRAAVGRAFNEMMVHEDMSKELRELDPVSGLRLLVHRHISFLARHPSVAPLIASESQFTSDRITWLTDTYIAPLEKHLRHLLELGQQQGRIRADLPIPHVVRYIVGGASALFMYAAPMKLIYDIDPADDAAVDTYARVTTELMFAGVLADGEKKVEAS